MPLSDEPSDELRRLEPAWYKGNAWVHWTMSIDQRGHGWLNDSLHGSLREILVHVCARYHLLCSAYCLMPDHAHFLFMGVCDTSDQRPAMKLLRKYWNELLAASGHQLQKQAYDHVLNETERNPEAFEDTLIYVLKNAERANFVKDWQEWKYMGAIAAGYPDFDPREGFQKFSALMWKIHHKERKRLQEG